MKNEIVTFEYARTHQGIYERIYRPDTYCYKYLITTNDNTTNFVILENNPIGNRLYTFFQWDQSAGVKTFKTIA